MTPLPDVSEAEVAAERPPREVGTYSSGTCTDGSSAGTEERSGCAAAPEHPVLAPEGPVRPDAAGLPGSAARPRRKVARVIALGMLVVVLGLVVVLAGSPSALQRQAQSPLVGKTAPPLAGTTITGAHYSLASFRGHFVFVDFFASWCVPCQESEPYLETFVRQHAYPGGARLVGVIFSDTVGAVTQFLSPWVGLYPVLPDPSSTIALDWGVGNPAEIYLVDPQGEVMAKVDGAVTTKNLDAMLTRARHAGA